MESSPRLVSGAIPMHVSSSMLPQNSQLTNNANKLSHDNELIPMPQLGTATDDGTTTAQLVDAAIHELDDHDLSLELEELQRRFRVMEMSRRCYADGSSGSARRQSAMIAKLKEDNSRLKDELELETRQAQQATNRNLGIEINQLQANVDLYERKLKQQRRKVRKLQLATQRMKAAFAEDAQRRRRQVLHGNSPQRAQTSASGVIVAVLHATADNSTENNIEADTTAASMMQLEPWNAEAAKAQLIGVNEEDDGVVAIQKTHRQIRVLENRLDKALVKYNQAVAHNQRLRAAIDELRRERAVLDAIFRKLQIELKDKKVSMAKLAQLASMHKSQRDAAQIDLLRLKQWSDSQQRMFQKQFDELGQILQKDRRLHQHLQQRADENQYEKSKQNGIHEGINATRVKTEQAVNGSSKSSKNSDIDAVAIEKELRQQVRSDKRGIRDEKTATSQIRDQVQRYDVALERIRIATSLNSVKDIVEAFHSAEDRNFGLFSTVNELNSTAEQLREQVSQLSFRLEARRAALGEENVEINGAIPEASKDIDSTDSSTFSHRRAIVNQLRKQLDEMKQKTEVNQNQYKESNQILLGLKDSIKRIVGKLGLDEDLVRHAHTSGVTEQNVIEVLGLIEQRVEDALEAWNEECAISAKSLKQDPAPAFEVNADEDVYSGIRIKLPSASSVNKLGSTSHHHVQTQHHHRSSTINDEFQMDMNGVTDFEDDESEIECNRPLSMAELKASTLRLINKQSKKESA